MFFKYNNIQLILSAYFLLDIIGFMKNIFLSAIVFVLVLWFLPNVFWVYFGVLHYLSPSPQKRYAFEYYCITIYISVFI